MKLLQLLLLLIPLALLPLQVSAQGSSSSPRPSPSPTPDPPSTRTTITVSPSPSPTVAPPTTSDLVTTSSRSNPVVTSTSFTIVDPTQSPSAASSPTPRPVTPGAPPQNNSNSASSLLQNTAFLVGIGIASGVVLLCAVVLAFVRARNKSSDNDSLSGLPWVHRPNTSSYGSHRPSNASSTLKSEMSLPQNYYSPKPLPASPRVIYPSTYHASPQTQPQQPSSPIDYNNYSYLPPSSSPYQQQPQQYPAQMQESIQYDPDIRPAMRYPTQSSASSSPRSNGFPAQSQTQHQSPLVLSQNQAPDQQFEQQNPVYDINYEQEAFNYDSPHANPIPVPPTHSPRTQSHTVQHSSSQSNLNRFRLPSPPPVMLEAPSTHVLSSDGSAYMNGNGNHQMDQGLVNAPTAFARPLPPPPNM